ncbi:MAG: hypothetical protein F4Z95_04970 [Gammaproteobacteria bacterium]|nr:hypothetical protein [Gammaproteobacteria bacterium]
MRQVSAHALFSWCFDEHFNATLWRCCDIVKRIVRYGIVSVSKSAWISAGKVSAAIAAVALLLGAVFQGQAQQHSDMADVRAELRSGFAEVNGRFAEVNIRLENISGDLVSLRERVARIEGHLALRTDAATQANLVPETDEEG